MTNVVQTLQQTVLHNQDAVAIDVDRDVSFSQFWSLTDQFAGGLRDRDVTAGDAVGICLTSPIEFLVAAYGTMRNGSVPVVIPTAYDSADIEQVAEETGAQGIVVDDRRFLSIVVGIPEMRFAVTVDNEQLLGVEFDAFLGEKGINAGGSRTGLDVIARAGDEPALVTYLDRDDPVATVYTHDALAAAVTAGADAVADGTVEQHLGCLPIGRPSGFTFGATATIFGGGRYRPVTEWTPREIAGTLYGDDVDRAYVTREQYGDLVDAGVEPGHDGVAVLDPLDVAATAPADGSTRICATEETGLTHVRSPADVEHQRIGTPLDGARVRVTGGDRGRLAVSGDTVMDGYFERPSLTEATIDETADAKWVRTDATGVVHDGEVFLEA